MFTFNVVLAMLIMIAFFAPLFLGRSYRKAAMSREEFRQAYLKKMSNRQFVLYGFGAVLYVTGLLAVLPWAVMALGINAPSIFRFVERDGHTLVVLWGRFVLDNTGFIVYWFLSPVFILVSLIGMNRFEKSKRLMDAYEQSMKERR